MAPSCTGAFPAIACPGRSRCLYQPDGGFLLPERCNVAHVEQALAHGAEVPLPGAGARVGRGRRAGAGAHRPRGRYEAGRLVVCAGPWAAKLVPELSGLAVPERQVLAWLQPSRPEQFRPDVLPGLQPGGGGGPLLRLPQLPHPRLQVREVPPPRGTGGSRRGEPRARAGGRGAAPRLRPALLPRRRRTDAHAQGLSLHQQPRPPLHPRPPPGASGGRRRRRVLRPRLQVLQRRRRGDGRPGRGAGRATTSSSSGCGDSGPPRSGRAPPRRARKPYVRAFPEYLEGGQFPHLDAIWFQYLDRWAPLDEFIAKHFKDAEPLGLKIVTGLNAINGGSKSSGIPGKRQGKNAMSADELQVVGVGGSWNSPTCVASWCGSGTRGATGTSGHQGSNGRPGGKGSRVPHQELQQVASTPVGGGRFRP